MRPTQSLRNVIVSCSFLAACGASDGAAPNGSASGGGSTSDGPGASGGGPGATGSSTPDTGDVPGRVRWWASEPSVTYKMFHLRAGIEWEHPGGDWTDATGTAQGTSPFASAEIADAGGEKAVSWDVTALVEQWLAEESRPTAVVLDQRGGNVRFHSREVAGKEPRLILTLADGTTVERLPSDDMTLDSSTTKVLGESETLGKRAIVQWNREALFAGVTNVTSATLSMISSVQSGKTNVDVYQMKLPIPDVLPPLEQGLAAGYQADTGIDKDPMVVFAEDFHGTVADVEARWDGSSFKELVPCGLPGVPQCARVTIKGKADGGSGLGGTSGRKVFDSELEEAFIVDDRDDSEKSDRRAGGPAGAHPRMKIKSSPGARLSASLASTWTLSARRDGGGRGVVGALPPGVSVDVDHVAVLSEAVDESDDAGGAREDRAPLLERQIRGDHGAGLLVTAADDGVEEVAGPCVAGQVPKLVESCGAPHNSTSLGYVPCDSRAADLLFHIVSRRHEARAIVITTNLAFKQWGSVFHDASCLGALVDRFAQHCHVLDSDAESWRNKEALQRSKPRKPRTS